MEEVSRVFSREISKAISGVAFGEISRVAAEIKSRKLEEGNQQFENECTECSKVQWESNQHKICFQQKTKLKDVIDELWKLMKIPKKSYNRVKQADHCRVEWRVRNEEGKDTGVLQHKVWKPERLHPKKNEDGEAYGQQQTRVWDPGRQELQMHDQEVMILSTLGV